jgi:hypothetical protein
MDYLAESKIVAKSFLAYILDTNDWKQIKDSDGIKISSRKSDNPKAGIMYKCEVTLDAPAAKVYEFVDPSKKYRIQWDGYLERLETTKKISDNAFLIYHALRPALKGIMSPRDSIDVVTCDETDDFYFVAASGVDCPDTPIISKYVRVIQYPCGYLIYKNNNDPEKCRFVMILNCDLKMNSVATFMSDIAKPTLCVTKINYLRDGLTKLDISS